MLLFYWITSLLVVKSSAQNDLPTNYEYFTSSGITSGITTNGTNFLLNGKQISIYSGSIHYFRNPRAYWRTRLTQFRAAGLNTVETYIPWSLHEPQSGVYDFGGGGSEMEDFLYIEEFLNLAKDEDLFVILRPGPYISAEYNFAAFPSWLLREKTMGFRTDEENYVKYFSRYYNILLPILEKYQFTKGGPVIAFQVENEYAYVGYNNGENYLEILRQLFLSNGIIELLVTSDNADLKSSGSLPGVLFQTVNFGDNPEDNIAKLEQIQPNRPLMVMEYWIGWFDHWTDSHQSRSASLTLDIYERILKYPASVNIYMFHGGCNFAFGNGAHLMNDLLDNSGFLPTTTSYDYDSPLTESGNYTEKYWGVKDLLNKYNPIKTYIPDPPIITPTIAYPTLNITQQIKLADVLTENPPYTLSSQNVVQMELLDINNQSGQSNGYIVYRKKNVDLEAKSVLQIEGNICDTILVLVNGELVSPKLQSTADLDGFGYWRLKNSSLTLNSEAVQNATIDLVVENWGRMHGGSIFQYNQTFKGLWQGDVNLNGEQLTNWQIIPMEFKKNWTNNLSSWKTKSSSEGPSLYLAKLNLNSEPRDTYIDMRNWSKGMVMVNGFPVGKYFRLGPQQALYLPGAFLKQGENDIVIFEHFKADNELRFVTDQIYETL